MAQVGGHINVDSVEGRGTTFTVYLPRLEQPAIPIPQPREAIGLPQGTELVLLVEDDEPVRRVSARVLGDQGYTVIKAADGFDALEIMGGPAGQCVDLLLTDMVMPRMSGKALADQVKKMCSRVRVLFISGYTEHPTVHIGELDPDSRFIRKPFTPATLVQKVRETLSQ